MTQWNITTRSKSSADSPTFRTTHESVKVPLFNFKMAAPSQGQQIAATHHHTNSDVSIIRLPTHTVSALVHSQMWPTAQDTLVTSAEHTTFLMCTFTELLMSSCMFKRKHCPKTSACRTWRSRTNRNFATKQCCRLVAHRQNRCPSGHEIEGDNFHFRHNHTTNRHYRNKKTVPRHNSPTKLRKLLNAHGFTNNMSPLTLAIAITSECGPLHITIFLRSTTCCARIQRSTKPPNTPSRWCLLRAHWPEYTFSRTRSTDLPHNLNSSTTTMVCTRSLCSILRSHRIHNQRKRQPHNTPLPQLMCTKHQRFEHKVRSQNNMTTRHQATKWKCRNPLRFTGRT